MVLISVEGFDRIDRTVEQLVPVDEVSGPQIDAQAMAEINHILNTAIRDPVGPGFMAPSARRRMTNSADRPAVPLRAFPNPSF